MKVMILTQTFDRPTIARLSLEQLAGVMPRDAELHVWDDHSSEPPDLTGIPHIAHRFPIKLGIAGLRVQQLQFAWSAGADAVYLTDSDALHDPEWFAAAVGGLLLAPVSCLYNSRFHTNATIEELAGYALRTSAPGISMMFRRDALALAMPRLSFCPRSWDYWLPGEMGDRIATTLQSFVEHIGAGGIHSESGDFEHDRAINPTPYLEEKRRQVITQLQLCGSRIPHRANDAIGAPVGLELVHDQDRVNHAGNVQADGQQHVDQQRADAASGEDRQGREQTEQVAHENLSLRV